MKIKNESRLKKWIAKRIELAEKYCSISDQQDKLEKDRKFFSAERLNSDISKIEKEEALVDEKILKALERSEGFSASDEDIAEAHEIMKALGFPTGYSWILGNGDWC